MTLHRIPARNRLVPFVTIVIAVLSAAAPVSAAEAIGGSTQRLAAMQSMPPQPNPYWPSEIPYHWLVEAASAEHPAAESPWVPHALAQISRIARGRATPGEGPRAQQGPSPHAGGMIVSVHDTYLVANGSLHRRTTTTSTLDHRGRLVRQVEDEYVFFVDPARRLTYTISYVPRGDIASVSLEIDQGANGSIDSRSTLENEYDARGHLVGRVQEVDRGADGTIEARAIHTIRNDGHGNPVEETREDDWGADGTVDGRYVLTSEYDRHGNVIRSRSASDEGADGTIDRRAAFDYAYDGRGNLTRWVDEYDYEADGAVDARVSRTYVYDPRGNRVRGVIAQDTPADGAIEILTVSVSEYDSRGNVVRVVDEIDTSANGTVDARRTYGYSYDRNGDLTRLVVDSDHNADGTSEIREVTTYTYSGHGPAQAATPAGGRDGAEVTTTRPVLAAASPNPFRDGTAFNYTLPASGPATLRVYDAAGRLVRTLADGTFGAGERRADWDGTDESGRPVPSGAYFARLSMGGREVSTTVLRAR